MPTDAFGHLLTQVQALPARLAVRTHERLRDRRVRLAKLRDELRIALLHVLDAHVVVHRFERVDHRLHVVRQRVISGCHAREDGIASDLRQNQRVEDRT
jgi:hypothetical protein